MYLFSMHRNCQQHVWSLRTRLFACGRLGNRASSKNQSMSILMTSINSFLSGFFKNSRAVALKHHITFNITNKCIGFFTSKSHYNNNPYRFTNKQRFLNTFGAKGHASCRIKLYGIIFSWEDVYMIYNPETNGRVMGMDIVNKYSIRRYVI